MNYNDITPLKFWCQKILPLSYDDSLSYYETLCRFADKVNELIERLNIYEDEYKKYIDEQVSSLKSYIDEQDYATKIVLEQKMDNLKNQTEEKITELRLQLVQTLDDVNAKIAEYSEALNKLETFVINDQNRQDIYFKNLLDEFYNKIWNLIDQYTNMIYNPTNGMITSIEQAINDIWNLLRYQAMNCIEFEWLNYDCDKWDSIEFTALDFDLYSGVKYARRLCDCWMINPYTGEKSLITDVIYTLIGMKADGLTCAQYDAKNLTAQTYDNKQITAYDFDFTGSIQLA